MALLVIAGAVLAGCASYEPWTFDEAMNSSYARKNDVGDDWREEMRYHVDYQYVKAAREHILKPELPKVISSGTQLEGPIAAADILAGGGLSGDVGTNLLLSFGGLPSEQRIAYHYNFALGILGNPGTHYYLLDERSGEAAPEDIDATWDEAHVLFQRLHNVNGECKVMLWDPDLQYRKTRMKNVRGIYKRVGYYCPHPLFRDEKMRVHVQAWANPFEGVRTIGRVVAKCWVKRSTFQNHVDIRGCGETFAQQLRPRVPKTELGLMELVITPRDDDPARFKVVTRYRDRTIVLPPPEPTESYVRFLEERHYTPLETSGGP